MLKLANIHRLELPKNENKGDYPIVIFYSAEDEYYIADIPDLRFCSAHGDTLEDALREILVAKQAWLDVAAEVGHKVFEPRDKYPVDIVGDAWNFDDAKR